MKELLNPLLHSRKTEKFAILRKYTCFLTAQPMLESITLIVFCCFLKRATVTEIVLLCLIMNAGDRLLPIERLTIYIFP